MIFNKNITNNEFKILEVLWNSGESMTSTQIQNTLEAADENFTRCKTQIHAMLSNLLDKELIVIKGYTIVSKAKTRLFVPVYTAEEFLLNISNRIKSGKRFSMPSYISNLFTDSGHNDNTIEILEDCLNQLKTRIGNED